MDANKNILSKSDQDKRLKNYSEVDSFNRLSDKDSETTSSLTAGGDESFISRELNGSFHQNS
ncbi:hypothetical protein [Clostridium aciditolerans]|uniref:Uncharacterized protein n=1 Tax=Clostridium aciditolerans TaxID=339861 RepID=A0A934HQK2_9CLOT|nr:hypothetical protein [Clostridium aciditolerans]MBI6872495.1 hypothetical protein [Clostridium aciditolerans]